MPTPEELQTALDELWMIVEAVKTRIKSDVDELEAKISELSGGSTAITPDDLAPVMLKINDLKTSIASIDPVPPPEEPAP